MANGRKEELLDFSDMSGGKNNARLPNAIGKNQVADCVDLILEQRGFIAAPAHVGLSATATAPALSHGLFEYRKTDGTLIKIFCADSKVYSLNVSTGAITELYTLSGTGECFGVNARNKFWIANGTDFLKIEGSTAYRAGIAAPTGATATAAAGGSLTAGVYTVYICYARKISGTIVLYSYPQTIGNVTLSGGNLSIAVTCANSSDPQVTDKVVFAIEPNRVVAYYYYDNADNTTTSFTISSNAGKNTNIILDVVAQSNYPIQAMTGIYYYDNRIIGWNGTTLYFSIKAGDDYSLERFPLLNVRQLPYVILSLFTTSTGDLFINTVGGVYKLAQGDLTAKFDPNDGYLYFKYPATVKEFKGLVWGVTNDGVRYFDGVTFSMDLSKDIKPDIDALNEGVGTNLQPCGEIHRRRGKRTEYHLSFRDLSNSSVVNNKTLVLNLDTLTINSMMDYKAAWETWSCGGSYLLSSSDGYLYRCQNNTENSDSVVSKESGYSEQYTYNSSGVFLTEAVQKKGFVKSKAIIPNIMAQVIYNRVYTIAQMSADCTVRVGIFDKDDFQYNGNVIASGGAVVTLPVVLGFVLPAANPNNQYIDLPITTKGKLVYIELRNVTADSLLAFFEIFLHGTAEVSNLS